MQLVGLCIAIALGAARGSWRRLRLAA